MSGFPIRWFRGLKVYPEKQQVSMMIDGINQLPALNLANQKDIIEYNPI